MDITWLEEDSAMQMPAQQPAKNRRGLRSEF